MCWLRAQKSYGFPSINYTRCCHYLTSIYRFLLEFVDVKRSRQIVMSSGRCGGQSQLVSVAEGDYPISRYQFGFEVIVADRQQ